jgi:hypothetical protein
MKWIAFWVVTRSSHQRPTRNGTERCGPATTTYSRSSVGLKAVKSPTCPTRVPLNTAGPPRAGSTVNAEPAGRVGAVNRLGCPRLNPLWLRKIRLGGGGAGAAPAGEAGGTPLAEAGQITISATRAVPSGVSVIQSRSRWVETTTVSSNFRARAGAVLPVTWADGTGCQALSRQNCTPNERRAREPSKPEYTCSPARVSMRGSSSSIQIGSRVCTLIQRELSRLSPSIIRSATEPLAAALVVTRLGFSGTGAGVAAERDETQARKRQRRRMMGRRGRRPGVAPARPAAPPAGTRISRSGRDSIAQAGRDRQLSR